MSFREPVMLAGLILDPAGRARLPVDAAAPPARGGNVREPGAAAQPRHRPPGLAPAHPAAADPARARHAGDRARPAAAHGGGAAARRDRGDGHRHLGLDERQRRRARPADRGRQGRATADRRAARDVPPRHGHVRGLRADPGAADHRPLAGARRARPPAGGGRHRDGGRPPARARAGARAGAERARDGDAAAARRARAAVGRQGHAEQHLAARGRARGAAAEDPDLRDRARHAVRRGRGARPVRRPPAHPRAARHRDAARDRPHHRRPLLRRPGRGATRVHLRQLGHPAVLAAGRARGHGCLRGRRHGAAAGRAERSRSPGSVVLCDG